MVVVFVQIAAKPQKTFGPKGEATLREKGQRIQTGGIDGLV